MLRSVTCAAALLHPATLSRLSRRNRSTPDQLPMTMSAATHALLLACLLRTVPGVLGYMSPPGESSNLYVLQVQVLICAHRSAAVHLSRQTVYVQGRIS